MKLLLIAFAAVLLTACSNKTEIDGEETRHVGWRMGEPVYETYYGVSPTYSQTFYYAFKTGYAWQLLGGIAVLGVSVFLLLRLIKDRPVFPVTERNYNWGMFRNIVLVGVVAIAGGMLVWGKPGNIMNKNTKAVTKAHFEANINDNFKQFWDSVYTNNLMIGAPYKSQP